MGIMLGGLLLLAAITGAQAGQLTDRNGRAWSYAEPPAQWFKVPYSGTIRVFYLPESSVNEVCGRHLPPSETANFFGCAIPTTVVCLIYITDDEPTATKKIILRHETAHCHGWPGYHPLTPPPITLTDARALPDWPDKPKQDASWFDARWPE